MKYTKEQMIEALTATKGQVFLASRKLGCAYNTMVSYIEKYPEVKAVLDEQHNNMGDMVELALYEEAVIKRNTAALIFLAKTKFKGRGYTEKIEIDMDLTIMTKFSQVMQEIGESPEAVLQRLIEAGLKKKQDAN